MTLGALLSPNMGLAPAVARYDSLRRPRAQSISRRSRHIGTVGQPYQHDWTRDLAAPHAQHGDRAPTRQDPQLATAQHPLNWCTNQPVAQPGPRRAFGVRSVLALSERFKLCQRHEVLGLCR